MNRRAEIWIAVGCLGFALGAALVWVPLDTETPLIYVFRRQSYIGDAMLPMVAAAGLGLAGLAHLLMVLRRDAAPQPPPFDGPTLRFLAQVALIIGAALLVMHWAGPLALELFGPEEASYRQMRARFPWAFIGFALGGLTLLFGLTTLIEGRLRAGRAVLAALAVLVLILLVDLPVSGLLLPPNGDF